MPVDSIITTIITRHMVTMAPRSNLGMPNWKGTTIPNHGAAATLAKLIIPNAAAATQPATMPISTAMLATKPRPYLVTARITRSTKSATASPSSAP